MKVDSLHLQFLQNEEHERFCQEFIQLVELHGAVKLNIVDVYGIFKDTFGNELIAQKKSKGSAKTEKIVIADSNRDFTFRGLSDEVKSKCRHYELPVREAAKRVWVVFKKYGNIARKSYDKATSAITNLLADLKADFTDDMALIGITAWVENLDADNQAFITLETNRYTELEKKTKLVTKQTRALTDKAYHKITKRINALIEINGEELINEFVTALNVRIKHFNDLIKQRRGRNDDDDKDDTP